MSPLGDDLAVDLFLVEVVPLDRHNDLVADGEGGVIVVEGIGAHDHHAVGEVAEDATGISSKKFTTARSAEGERGCLNWPFKVPQ